MKLKIPFSACALALAIASLGNLLGKEIEIGYWICGILAVLLGYTLDPWQDISARTLSGRNGPAGTGQRVRDFFYESHGSVRIPGFLS